MYKRKREREREGDIPSRALELAIPIMRTHNNISETLLISLAYLDILENYKLKPGIYSSSHSISPGNNKGHYVKTLHTSIPESLINMR